MDQANSAKEERGQQSAQILDDSAAEADDDRAAGKAAADGAFEMRPEYLEVLS